MQITGEYKSVQNALFRVTGTLRDNQVRAKYPGVTVSEDPLRNDPVPHYMDACPSPLRFQLPQVKIHLPSHLLQLLLSLDP